MANLFRKKTRLAAAVIAEKLLREHEGLRLRPYQCPAGKLTIGYGRNLDDSGITKPEAEHLLYSDIQRCINDLRTFSYWRDLTPTRRAVLIDLRFCVGQGGYRQFVKLGESLARQDYKQAAAEILDSKFARQTGQRARTLAKLMRAG